MKVRDFSKVVGIGAFVAMALGSATTQLSQRQEATYKAGTWVVIVDETEKPFYYDPYSYRLESSGNATFNYLYIDTAKNYRIGPTRAVFSCLQNQYENIVDRLDGSTESKGMQPIPDGSRFAIMKTKLCGMTVSGDRKPYYYLLKAGSWEYYFAGKPSQSAGGVTKVDGVMKQAGASTTHPIELTANCQSRTVGIVEKTKGNSVWETTPIGDKNSNSSIAFDRACNSRIAQATLGGAVGLGMSIPDAKRKCSDLGMKPGVSDILCKRGFSC